MVSGVRKMLVTGGQVIEQTDLTLLPQAYLIGKREGHCKNSVLNLVKGAAMSCRTEADQKAYANEVLKEIIQSCSHVCRNHPNHDSQ